MALPRRAGWRRRRPETLLRARRPCWASPRLMPRTKPSPSRFCSSPFKVLLQVCQKTIQYRQFTKRPRFTKKPRHRNPKIPMRLSQLLQPADLLDQPTDNDVDVAGLALDSRHVGPGFLFAALPGQHASGAQFVAEAVQRGAAVVLCGLDDKIPESSAQVLRVAQPRLTLARMAARFYGPQPKHVVAVTGTSGKSSVVDYVRQIWNHCGLNGASIGTLGAITAHQHDDTNLTTPDCITLHQQLQKLAAAGVQRVAIEASSHGLEMQRLHAVNKKEQMELTCLQCQVLSF
ncbi:MAG: hypothetical protein EB121_07220 [Alphaproteobacteria bacterium]|nr:hypothetical protein [Alphaproteobacteria bacterium]